MAWTEIDGSSTAGVGAPIPWAPAINVKSAPYNMVGDGSDETAKFQLVVTAINAAGGGAICLPPGNYGVTSKLTTLATYVVDGLFTLTNLNGIRLIGDNATITDLSTYTGTQDAYLFNFSGCKGIDISGIGFVAPAKANYSTPHGLWFLNFTNGCSRIRVDASCTGGECFIHPTKLNADAETLKSTNLDVRIDCTNVERPVACEYSGDNGTYRIVCDNAGRPYIIWGVSQTEFRVRTKNQQGAIAVVAIGGKNVRDHRAWIVDRDSTTRISANPEVILTFDDATVCGLYDLYFNFDVVSPAAANNFSEVLQFGDASVGSGHTVDGLTVEGTLEPISTQYAMRNLNIPASPDVWRRIKFQNITSVATTGGIYFQLGDALQDVAEISNCYIPNGNASITRSTGGVVVRNTVALNHMVDGGIGAAIASTAGVITPTARRQHVTGTNAITGITATLFADGETWTVVPDGAFTWTTATNIAVAGTAVVNKAITFTWDATAAKWYPSYV